MTCEQPPLHQPESPSTRRQRLAFIRDLLPFALILILTLGGIRLFLEPYEVVGTSMSPTLNNGERLFVNQMAYAHLSLPFIGMLRSTPTPQRGDIVILDSAKTRRHSAYIKRVVALPGETVRFADGIVLIDNEPLVEDYIDGAITICVRLAYCSVTIPDGYVYVLGDNRTNSEDSRSFGPVPIDDLRGRAWFGLWPREKLGPISRPEYNLIPES